MQCSADASGARGGAVAFLNNATAVVAQCRFERNTATLDGGSILMLANDGMSLVQVNITNSVFRDNFAGRLGGSIMVHGEAGYFIFFEKETNLKKISTVRLFVTIITFLISLTI